MQNSIRWKPSRTRLLTVAVSALVLHLATAAGAVAQEIGRDDLSRPVPMDTAVRMGVLSNGMRYYVRRNVKPEKRAELRLVVNAGSVLEDEDQRGLAHFLEHMAFNGTRNFKKNELVKYLESVGMRFGADLNASTSYDETIYMLTIPTDTQRVVSKALQILEDWAHQITLNPKDVTAERGVVLEEWRARRGAGARLREQHDSVMFRGSQYAVRSPIGTRERIETARREELLRFYRDWYRPDLMAVIAVGDFDEAAMAKEIEKRFARIRAVKHPRTRPAVTLPENTEPLVSIGVDKEATGSSVEVLYKLPPSSDRGTVGAYRTTLVRRLFAAMLNQRLSELARRPDAPFLGAGSGSGTLVREAPVEWFSVSAKEGAMETGLAALLGEVERVAQHGFTAAELERTKASLIRGQESAVAARDAILSAAYTESYINNYLTGSSIAGVEGSLALMRELLPGITLDEVGARARIWRQRENRVIVANLPEKSGTHVPSSAGLLAVFDSVAALTFTPYEEKVADAPLVAILPTPGQIASERTIDAAGVREWKLSNGVRVLLKPTDFNKDEVAIRGYSPGGTSLAPDSIFRDASLATGILSIGGLGEFPLDDLRKRLAGTVVSVGASIGSATEEVSAGGSPKDLETIFQLLYLQVTAPRVDSAAVQAYKASLREQLMNRANSPAAAFQDTIISVMTQAHPRARPITAAAVDSLDVMRSLRFFVDRFGDASDFTFVIVGAFDPDSIRPLVERYLGGLPSLARKEEARDVGIRAPRGVVTKLVRAGKEPRSDTRIFFTGEAEVTPESQHLLGALTQVLQRRLTETLREKLGGTYSPSVQAGMSRRPVPRYEVTIGFGSAPERVNELVETTLDVVRALRQRGPTQQEVHDVSEAQRRQRETGLRQNGYWLNTLALYDQEGWDFASIARSEPPGGGRALTAARIKEAAERYLDLSNYVQVTLMPEQTAH